LQFFRTLTAINQWLPNPTNNYQHLSILGSKEPSHILHFFCTFCTVFSTFFCVPFGPFQLILLIYSRENPSANNVAPYSIAAKCKTKKEKYKKDAQTNKKNKKKRTQAIKKRNKTG